MIFNMSGGGGAGIDLTVVGGTEQPANPKENTVWVNTETEIGEVYFSPAEPASPAAGDVWINTGNKYTTSGANASPNILMVSEDPYLEINVFNISQYSGTEWVLCPNSGIYANGAWTTLALYIYNYGTQNSAYPIIARHTPTTAYSSTLRMLSGDDILTYGDTSFAVNSYSGTNLCVCTTPIDFGLYNTLNIVASKQGTSSNYLYVGYVERDEGGTNPYFFKSEDSDGYGNLNMTSITDRITLSATASIDCGAISGMKRLAFNSYSNRYYEISYICLTA